MPLVSDSSSLNILRMAPTPLSVEVLRSLKDTPRCKSFDDAVKDYVYKGGTESIGCRLDQAVRNKIAITYRLEDVDIRNARNSDICLWVAALSAKPSGEQLATLLNTKLVLNASGCVDSEQVDKYYAAFTASAKLMFLGDDYLKHVFCKGLASAPIIAASLEADRKNPSVDLATLASTLAFIVSEQEQAASTGAAILAGSSPFHPTHSPTTQQSQRPPRGASLDAATESREDQHQRQRQKNYKNRCRQQGRDDHSGRAANLFSISPHPRTPGRH